MNRKEFLIITVGIFMTIIAWIVIDVYHVRIQKGPQQDATIINVPSYNIDRTIIDKLLKKVP